MRFKVTATVKSNLLLPAVIRFHVEEYSVSLVPDSEKLWFSIELIQDVSDYESMIPHIERQADGLSHIDMRGGDLFRRSSQLLQYIEALGSFWLEVYAIDWATPEVEWVPESDDERQRLQVFSFKTHRQFRETPKPFERERLGFISERARDGYLTIPMSFFREGMNDFRQFRFINAFFNFYFFLEGLYGNGKTKNRQVLAEFKKSSQLRQSAEKFLVNLRQVPEHQTNLEMELKSRGWKLCSDRLLDLLVSMRGQLHHYSLRSTGVVGHPLNQAQFETIAFAAMQVCLGCYIQLARGTPPS